MITPLELPEGYYFDEVHGAIEKLDAPDWHVSAEAAAQDTFTLYEEVSRGIVGHGIDRDEQGYLFLGVAKAVYEAANTRYVDVYMKAPGEPLFDPTPIAPSWYPTLKIDIPGVLCDGPHLLLTATTHKTVEAPRPSKVEGFYLENVCHVKDTSEPRGGACVLPGNRPYFRPNNHPTRGQLCKIIAIALGLPLPTDGRQTFEDVPPTGHGSDFYPWIEAVHEAQAINGYPCE